MMHQKYECFMNVLYKSEGKKSLPIQNKHICHEDMPKIQQLKIKNKNWPNKTEEKNYKAMCGETLI